MASIVRIAGVMTRTGLPRSTLYAQVKRGDFPRPIKLGVRAVGWRVEDVEAWIAARPQGGTWSADK